MRTWDHKDEWHLSGIHFLVTVRRHSQSTDEYLGPNRWAVYAFIYPKHPYFCEFSGGQMWQDAAIAMPLHGGPSLLEYPMHKGEITSVKIGSDYNHLHDEEFSHYATKDDAAHVFGDAETLHAWLTTKGIAS